MHLQCEFQTIELFVGHDLVPGSQSERVKASKSRDGRFKRFSHRRLAAEISVVDFARPPFQQSDASLILVNAISPLVADHVMIQGHLNLDPADDRDVRVHCSRP